MDFVLTETSLDCKLRVMVPCFDDWMHVKRAQRMVATKEERKVHEKAIDAWFQKHPLISIDGVVVDPTINDIKFITVTDHAIKIDYVELNLSFSVKARPRTVLLSWTEWEIFPTWPLGGMDALFAWDDDQIAIGLYPEEPQYMWHAPAKASAKAVLPEPPPAPPRISVPLLSLACLVGLLFFVPMSFLLKLGLKVRWGGVVVLLILSAALQGQMVKTMRPPWLEDAKLPTVAEAQDIFAALQQNTYRAFDSRDEDKIYDVLSRSIDGALLERVYGEIFESLLMRDEGGVVCLVKKVEILKSEITLPKDPEKREFKVKAKWRVVGKIVHYGHPHLRVNQYNANYTVSEREEGWRISEVEILHQRRIDPKEVGLGQ